MRDRVERSAFPTMSAMHQKRRPAVKLRSVPKGQEQTPVVHKISRSQFIITHRKIGRIWPFDEQWPLVDRNCNAQECCGNRSGVLAWAFVLAAEQSFQFLLEITGSAVLLCGFESVHGRPVEFSKCIN
jgi:hypothetical protein